MKNILSLCFYLLLLVISDIVSLKIIAGNRSVIKKDGATHTISKYYIVPNNYDSNNATTHSIYSKSMDSNAVDEDQVNVDQKVNNQTNVDVDNVNITFRSDMNDVQAKDNTAESKELGNTEQRLDTADLGILQVEPITIPSNISSSFSSDTGKVLRNEGSEMENVDNSTQTNFIDIADQLDNLILSRFGQAVHESSIENIESFWKLVKLNIDQISDVNELMARIERLSLLINVFTTLYEAAQLDKPIDSMIDSMIDILEIPYVVKSNKKSSQSKIINISVNYDEECLRECGQKRSKPQLDSNGTYLSETESQEASGDIKLENLDLQRRHRGDSNDLNDLINTSDDPNDGLNVPIVRNQTTNIPQSQVLVPDNVTMSVPDGNNSYLSTMTLNRAARDNDIQEEPMSNQTILDLAGIEVNSDDLPLTIQSKITEDWPRSIKDESTTGNLPWTIKTITADNLPWHIKDKKTDNLPRHIEDKKSNYHPWTIQHRTTLPWTMEDRTDPKWIIEERADPKWITANPKWTIADKTDPKWTIEGRTDPMWKIEDKATPEWTIEDTANLPKTWYQSSSDPRFTTKVSEILLHPKQPSVTSTVYTVKHRVNKPYHIYTYVTNPATSLHKISSLNNIVKGKSRQPNNNLVTKIYSLSTSHGGNKVVYKKPQSYYKTQFSVSKPSIDINSLTSDSLLLSVPKVDSHPEVLLTKHYLNPIVSLPNLESKATDRVSELLNANTIPNSNSPDIVVNLIDQIQRQPSLISKPSFSSTYTNSPDDGKLTNELPVLISASSSSDVGNTNKPDDNDELTNRYSEQPYQQPGFISKASSHSEYINVPDVHDQPGPVYDDETYQQPGFISYSKHTNVPDIYEEPTPVYGEETYQQPGFISKASSHSEYINLLDGHDQPAPVYDDETYQRPGFISYSKYTNVPDIYEEPTPVYGEETYQQPGFISKASTHSEYINLPDGHDQPAPVYDDETYQQPGFISYSKYKNLPDIYEEPTRVNGEKTYQQPGFISHSKYSNVPDFHDQPAPIYSEEVYQQPGFISHSKYTNTPDVYDQPTPVYSEKTYQQPSFISHSKYTNVPNVHDQPAPIYSEETYQQPGFISHSKYTNIPDVHDQTAPVYNEETYKQSSISKASSHSEYKNLPDVHDQPVPIYDDETYQQPGFISYSKYTNVPDIYEEPTPVYGEETYQQPGFISHSKYTNVPDIHDQPAPIHYEETYQQPGFISHSKYTNTPDVHDQPTAVYSEETYQQPGFISHSKYTNVPNVHDQPAPIYSEEAYQQPGFISPFKYTNVPDVLDQPAPVYSEEAYQQPGFMSHSKYTNIPDVHDQTAPVYNEETYKQSSISKASSHSEYISVPDVYDKPASIYDEQTSKHPEISDYPEYTNVADQYDVDNNGDTDQLPDRIAKASSHSKYTNLPNDDYNPTPDYEEYIEAHPGLIHNVPHYPKYTESISNYNLPTHLSDGSTENKDHFLMPFHLNGHTVNNIQPSLITHLHGNQPIGLNYHKLLQLKLAPTYHLFTSHNLLKLYKTVTKIIEINGDNIYDARALKNLKTIIKIILILADHFGKFYGSEAWYENIFYNTKHDRHPLQLYVYKLLRQRWLHELMLVLFNNDFNHNIFKNPRIFSFLESWHFPNHVQNFLEAEKLIHHNLEAPFDFDETLDTQNSLEDKFSTHRYDELLGEVPEDLENYVTRNVVDSYKAPNGGIVLSIAGVDAEPDATVIINILQRYLNHKSIMEKHEHVINRDNRVEMLKQVIWFLREKGYDANIIADLIHKLYNAVYATEGSGCKTHYNNFAKNMYDVILPVLRRSGR